MAVELTASLVDMHKIVHYRTPASSRRVSYDDDKAGKVIEVTGEITISIDLAKLGLHLGHALINKDGKASLAGGAITATVTDGPRIV